MVEVGTEAKLSDTLEKRAYAAYFADQAQTSGEIVKSMAEFAKAELLKAAETVRKQAKWLKQEALSCPGPIVKGAMETASAQFEETAKEIERQAQ